MTRTYQPATLEVLAALLRDAGLPADADRYVAEDESEEAEYAALTVAAEASARLLGGPGRRVVVVAQLADPDGPLRLRDVVAVHADPVPYTDPDEDLGWYAPTEIGPLLAGL